VRVWTYGRTLVLDQLIEDVTPILWVFLLAGAILSGLHIWAKKPRQANPPYKEILPGFADEQTSDVQAAVRGLPVEPDTGQIAYRPHRGPNYGDLYDADELVERSRVRHRREQ
jgi:hypothetical protein